ncbi:hypothetical protein E4631_08860 [Hymenobacter sp. UV11]|uniref:hypothetical protein n=1 Tax=Hymenobacter sp. UV11 TaxID=1849735 RepID=UPI00105F32B0|nr:hypothetical protein [Hymenobacter sp. UV11]TDN36338.1 hypothetical protein A8B98_10565 [Hymenobacter sp. UV11]TFZ67052.1 hypothetical protein E4631_08860 [Hymenobacter sp. UV11]
MALASSPTVFFENIAGQVLVQPAGYLYSCWSANPRTFAETKALLLHLSQGLKHFGWSRVLSNQLAMPPFSAEEQAWITQEWLPLAVHEAGYRAGAILLATNLYARLATAFVTNVQGLPIRYRSFDNEAEAEAWLLLQQ